MKKGNRIITCIVVLAVLFTIKTSVSFIRYPELYMTTWKHSLERDLKKGNVKMLEYYNDNYVANGKYLFGDKYIK